MSNKGFFRRFLAAGLALLMAYDALGAASGAYTAEVAVNTQADSERAEALKSGLGQVVVRLTGDSGVLAREEVARRVADAERYVQQFQYRQDSVVENGQTQVRLVLVVQFDHDAVDQLLGTLGPSRSGAVPGDAVANHPATYHVWIGAVHSADDYARLIGALSAHDMVRELSPEQARGDGVLLKLVLNGSLPSLLTSPALANVLHLVNAKPPIDGVDAIVNLQP